MKLINLKNISKHQKGGLSGKPLEKKSNQLINKFYTFLNGKIDIIGVGGIDSVDSAWDMINSGASLIQLYSALVFQGPSVMSHIVRGLKKRVYQNNFSNIQEAVGYYYK